MARATAICTCKECGNAFEKYATKPNRREADNWENWAVGHYDQCPSCWGKEQRELEQSQPPNVSIGVDPYNQKIILNILGNTKPIKDILKENKYRFDEAPMQGFLGIIDMSRPKLCWWKMVSLDELDKELDNLKEIHEDIQISKKPSNMDMIMFAKIAKENEKKEELISQIPKPVVPEVFINNKGRWNQKVYGKEGNYSIYLSNEKIEVTDEEADQIKNYAEEKKKYNEEVDKIKNSR